MTTAETHATIAKEAAFLSAVLMDATLDPKQKAAEVRDTLAELVPMLQRLGLMEPYERAAGVFGI